MHIFLTNNIGEHGTNYITFRAENGSLGSFPNGSTFETVKSYFKELYTNTKLTFETRIDHFVSGFYS